MEKYFFQVGIAFQGFAQSCNIMTPFNKFDAISLLINNNILYSSNTSLFIGGYFTKVKQQLLEFFKLFFVLFFRLFLYFLFYFGFIVFFALFSLFTYFSVCLYFILYVYFKRVVIFDVHFWSLLAWFFSFFYLFILKRKFAWSPREPPFLFCICCLYIKTLKYQYVGSDLIIIDYHYL